MTRATLLQLLAHPTAITGADVRALEKLADTFPYCQTAHLLLAKAAHDQGSMLAGQRLRRAATYAADRTRLRQLIELPPPLVAEPTPTVATTLQAELFGQTDSIRPEAAPTDWPASAGIAATLPEDASTPGSDNHLLITTNQPTTLLLDLPEQMIEPVALPVSVLTPAHFDEPPAQAPPIRPPVEAATAHAEFGLADDSPAELMAYRLPELDAAAPAPLLAAVAVDPAPPLLLPFSGLADVGYAPSEGSRLGFCLLLAATEPSAVILPPTGEFFAPDALLLAHLAAQPSGTIPKTSSLDLINSFLRRVPAPTRRRTPPPPDVDEQADLSVRSTRPEPDLASESLAKILGRQGKVDRAIAIYERLMVKQPEKMAYFAAQIESLRPSA